MASSKINFTTISKPAHVPVRQKIIDIETPLADSRESSQPQPVLIKDTQDVTSAYKPIPKFQNTHIIL